MIMVMVRVRVTVIVMVSVMVTVTVRAMVIVRVGVRVMVRVLSTATAKLAPWRLTMTRVPWLCRRGHGYALVTLPCLGLGRLTMTRVGGSVQVVTGYDDAYEYGFG